MVSSAWADAGPAQKGIPGGAFFGSRARWGAYSQYVGSWQGHGVGREGTVSKRKWTVEDVERHVNRLHRAATRATCGNCGSRGAQYDVDRLGMLVVECARCGCTTILPRQTRRTGKVAA